MHVKTALVANHNFLPSLVALPTEAFKSRLADFRRRMESCTSEHKGTSSYILKLLASFLTSHGLSFALSTAALAVDL